MAPVNEQEYLDVIKGLNLGLGAIGEQLTKTNEASVLILAQLKKADEAEAEEEDKKEEEIAKAAFTSEIVKAVVSQLAKSDAGSDGVGASAGGMPVDGKTEKPVSGTKWPMAGNPAEDKEQPTTAEAETTKTVQEPLALATTDVQVVKMGEEDGSEEYPQVEDEGVPGDDPMAIMNAKIDSITKAVTDLAKSQASAVDVGIEAQMRKIGWKEAEVGGKPRVRILPDGGDPMTETAELSKSVNGGQPTPEQIVDQLVGMSYADMAEMQVSMVGGAAGLIGPAAY